MADTGASGYRPCVGVMLANSEGRVFVGRRIDNPVDAWQMPQGGIDPGEDPRAAALRELREETGITADLVTVEAEAPEVLRYDLPANLAGSLWHGRYRGQEQRWFLMRYHGTDAEVDIATDDAEFDAWQWLDAVELPHRIVPFKRAIYERLLEAFGPRLRA